MNPVSNQLIAKFSQFIGREMGLYFPENKHRDLERTIHAISQALHFSNIDDCMTKLMKDELTQQQIEILASYLTVGETYFFRDPGLYSLLQNTIIPGLITSRNNNGKYLRIWSAGCSTGEEPYSVAITLLKSIADIKNWHISIIASDINTKALKKMQDGKYTDWSFRGVSNEIKYMYFDKSKNNSYIIKKSIREMVDPNYINLCKDSYPSLMNKTNGIDIILCRNVLMYFSPELIKKIIEKFYHCLSENGYLIVSPCEYIYDYVKDYSIETISGVTVYRKKPNQEKILSNIDQILDKQSITNKPCYPSDEVKIKEIPLKGKPTHEEVIHLAGDGKLNEALILINQILPEDKTNVEFHYLKAMILVELLRHDEAIKSLDHVLYLNHNFVPAYIALANIFLHCGNKLRAKKNYQCAYVLLEKMKPNEKLPDSAGMTVERVMNIVKSAMELI